MFKNLQSTTMGLKIYHRFIAIKLKYIYNKRPNNSPLHGTAVNIGQSNQNYLETASMANQGVHRGTQRDV